MVLLVPISTHSPAEKYNGRLCGNFPRSNKSTNPTKKEVKMKGCMVKYCGGKNDSKMSHIATSNALNIIDSLTHPGEERWMIRSQRRKYGDAYQEFKPDFNTLAEGEKKKIGPAECAQHSLAVERIGSLYRMIYLSTFLLMTGRIERHYPQSHFYSIIAWLLDE